MRVLVTGGAGYIGSITSELLIQSGLEVTAYDDLSTGNSHAIPKNATFVHGDILDSENLQRAMQGCDAIVHFAGRALVTESFTKPEEYFSINSDGSNLLFEVAVSMGIKKIVVASSCAVYGDKYLFPISESENESPINPYGFSKLRMDNYLSQKIMENPNIGGISLRFFNVAGALRVRDKWIGESHYPETHVIPNIMRSNANEPFVMFGDDYATPDGTSIRDYVHVVDIAEAHILALNCVIAGKHEIINLGTNTGHSLRQLIDIHNSLFNTEIPVVIRDRRIGDPDFLVANNSKAEELLKWKPIYGIERMMLDHKNYLLESN